MFYRVKSDLLYVSENRYRVERSDERSDLLYVSENRYRVEIWFHTVKLMFHTVKLMFHTVKHLLYVSENRYRVEISDLISESISQNLVLVSNPRFYSVNPTGLVQIRGTPVWCTG